MPENKLETESLERLRDARRWKEWVQLDMQEAYFFACPRRQRTISSQTQPSQAAMLDAPVLNTDLAFILTPDFVTEVINTYMPEAQLWCERGAGMDIPAEAFDKIKDDVKAADKKIFSAMKASNLYAELPKAFNPDLAIGASALWIERRHPSVPISVSAVPLRELEINLGPDGNIDDRFAVRWPRNSHVKAIVGDEVYDKISQERRTKLESSGTAHSQLAFGFWRVWDRYDDEHWQKIILLNNELIHSVEIKGEGSCELLPIRFNPVADWPHGIGPLIQGLPDFRQIDELEFQKIKGVTRAIAPPISYPDDSFAQVEQGLEEDMAYPIRPGTEGAIKPIYEQRPLDPAIFQLQDMEHRLRKLFFVDFPEQSGDTPPTLGQWLDEMARAQRRIGTPGQSFWREGPAQIFLRFKYLLEVAGAIEPVKVDGRTVALMPYNPAQRAAEQQEIATATQCAQILAQMFPEEWRMVVDGRATMEGFIEKMRTSGLIKLRDKVAVKAAVEQMAQLLGTGGLRQKAGAPVPEGAGAPGP